VPALQDLLAELTSGDDRRAEESIPAIIAAGEGAIPPLLDLTRGDSEDGRWWAIRALAASPFARTEDLVPHLEDPTPEVRAAAALAISNHPDVIAVPALIKALRDDDSLTAFMAGNALARIGTPAVDGLLLAMRETSTSARIQALRALAEIRDARAVPTMMEALNADSALLQYWAREGLERLGVNMVYLQP
jgi:HEAT repeat protein